MIARLLCVVWGHEKAPAPERGGQPVGWLFDPIGPTRDMNICGRCSVLFVSAHEVRPDTDFNAGASNAP